MMKFESIDGSYFETHVVGYENYPHQVDNWLVNLSRLKLPFGVGYTVSAYATTDEYQMLAEWLGKVANRTALTTYFLFQEPLVQYKSVTYAEDKIIVRMLIYFSAWHDIEPMWVSQDGHIAPNANELNFTFDFVMTSEMIETAAHSLREELEAYPPASVLAANGEHLDSS